LSKKPEKPKKPQFTATCKCKASNTAESESQAVTYIVHNDGCNNDLTHWQDWITVKETE
jgi:hypothetical protein